MADPIVKEIRALLRTFLQSDWKALDIKTGTLQLFMSRDPTIRALGMASAIELTAPHLGTVASLAVPGAMIEAGGVFGKLIVLDEERDLIAESGGKVACHLKQAGDLVEFGEPLLELAA